MKKALLFGATGLLGQALAKTLKARNWELAAPAHSDLDLRDFSSLEMTISETNPDCVFNAVAWTAVDEAEDNIEAAYELNETVPANIAKILAARKECSLIHFSTDFVFSSNTFKALPETADTDPQNIYGASKLTGEKQVLANLPDRSCIIRTAWLFGPGRKNFVDTILALARKREVIKVVADQTGSPTYVNDLADWSEKLANGRKTGIFHGVNSNAASWLMLAQKTVEIAGLPCRVLPIPSSEWPQKAKRPAFSVLDNKKLADTLGLAPRLWEDALGEYILEDKGIISKT